MSEIIDVYEMTPVQAGMLFHSLHAPEGGVYFQQYWCRLDGDLDQDAFRAAWDQVTARHDILRSQCHWEDLEVPAHVILDQVSPEWQVEDWQDTGDDAGRLSAWLDADRARGFDMATCPLMRFALMRVGPQAHVFVWSFHHLLIDGWCGALLVREMLSAYGGADLGPTPAPFRDYVEWLEAQDPSHAEAYWRETLSGIEETTPLGVDHVATGAQGMIEHRARFPRDLTERLTELTRRERLTLNTVMQGAWGLILSRYCGQGDVCFGTVLSGRPPELPGVEEMIGLFLTTVPARVSVEDQPLLPWLHDIQSQQRQREQFGHVALTDIQQWSGLGAATPLFESLLIVETYPQSIEAVADRNGSALRMSNPGVHERTNYPLTLKTLPGDEVELCLTADAARLTQGALRRLAGHLEQVVQSIVSSPEQCLNQVQLLTDAEQQTQIAVGQGPDRAPAPLTLDQILMQVQAQPHAEALRSLTGYTLTYGDIERRSGQIAAALAERGVVRGDIVAVCQERTPDLVATLLAIWRVGAAYLPLDPIYPADRITYILQDSDARLAVVDDRSLSALGDSPGVTPLDVAHCHEAEADLIKPEGSDLAYILYTSGSTGKPKGVRIAHDALANFLTSMQRAPCLTAQDRLLAVTTVSFDIAALELFGPLCAGGVVVLGDAGLGADGGRLGKALSDHAVTVMQATPVGWRVLVESGWTNDRGLKMLSGGEALDAALARQLLNGNGWLWNLYGPTETTVWSAAMQITTDMVQGAKTPVGGPLDNTQLYVLDRAGQVAPVGVAGELLIGGAGLSTGYHNRPDLTADRFATDLRPDAGRLYRTGDNVRWSEDGTLEFMGRLDDQVKLRGYRIELGEIEARLESHPDIQQAVAMVRNDGPGPRLVGYLRLPGAAPSEQELRDHLSNDLPGYMVPAAWVMLDAFPLTPNGKINRRELPAPDRGAEGAQTGLSVQMDVVASIWADVLGVEQVRAEDSFFDLGGHSLLATRLIGAVGQALSVEVSLRDLFEAPDLATFCDRITALQGAETLPPMGKATGTAVLSYAQQRQWLMAQFNPADTAYLLPLTVRLDGVLNVDALQAALTDVASRHDILRSSYPAENGQATVQVHPTGPVAMPVTDLTDSASPDQDLREAQTTEAQTPIDVTTAAPWRLRLLRFGPQSHVLLITLHHILADEWSFDLLQQEVSDAYSRILDQQPGPALTPLQYTDYAAWQCDLDLKAERDYWRWQLEAAPPLLPLPADFGRPTRRSAAGGRVPIQLGPDAAANLRDMARGQGSTLFICLMAAYAVFLHRHTDEDDLVIGTPVSNRHSPETQRMIGLFVNTLAIRTRIEADLTFADLIAQTRETVLTAHASQNIPFEQVIDALSLPRSESHAPLVQTLFSMQSLPESSELYPDLQWKPEPGAEVNARFDLSLSLRDTGDGIEGYFDYASDLFTRATVERFAGRLTTLLEGLADNPNLPICDLPLLPNTELQNIEIWSRGALSASVPLASRMTIHDDPTLALDFNGVRLSYGALRGALEAGANENASINALIGAVAEMLSGSVTLNGVQLSSAGLEQIGTLPLPAGARLSWDGTTRGLGLVQVIAALSSGATLVDTNADVRLIEADHGLELQQPDSHQRYYSPSEMPIALYAEQSEMPLLESSAVLGRPRPNVLAHVLHRSGQLAPVGSVGELCLGGPALARGYVANPIRTAERFRPNPNVDPQDFRADEACLWHSGLLVRQDASGALHLVGEVDDQVRIAGQRISPARIEACIAGHPAIAEAALKLPEGGQKQLEAVLVLQPGATQPTDSELTRHILEQLPDYLVPRRLHWVSTLPRDAEGNLDRTALTQIGARRDSGAPQGPAEIELASIWAAVLQVERIGRHDNFFDLGGDSILAMQIVARMGEAGYQIEPRDLFHHQSVAALAEVARKQDVQETAFDLPEIDGLDMDALAASVSFGET